MSVLFGLVFVGPAGAPAAVTSRETGAFPGYTLVVSQTTTDTYLIDLDGKVVHSWRSDFLPGLWARLRPDGLLLRAGRVPDPPAKFRERAGGAGGIVQLLDWDSNVIGQFEYANDEHVQHHDAVSLPNGNVLMLAWDFKTADEAIAMGRDPSTLPNGRLYPDSIIEVDVQRGTVVWEWHVWDHLVQDFDPRGPNYGAIGDHPRRIDLNWVTNGGQASWNHFNGIDYDAGRDQIVVSSREFSEVWVIDHDTTTKQARGRRGDLLARFGNPQTYGQGGPEDRVLFYQHNPSVIPKGTPGAGKLLVFSNGDVDQRPFSTVDEIIPARNGRHFRMSHGVFKGHVKRLYPTARTRDPMFANFIGGVQRLPNGSLLITDGPTGHVSEITKLGTEVWSYDNDFFAPAPVIHAGDFEVRPERLFRAVRYPDNYRGLRGHTLAPSAPDGEYHY